MYHSLIITGKNTYDEWEMVPTTRPVVAPPEVKTKYVDLPTSDGSVDYTETLNRRTTFGRRTGSWEFLLIPGDRWAQVYSSLLNYLHGKKHTIILEDDPSYFYTGRLSVDEWNSEAHNSLIVINYELDPYKQSVQQNDDEWLWDTSFENTIMYSTFNVTDSVQRTVVNPYNRYIPILIICSEDIKMYCAGDYYELVTGENQNGNIQLKPGENSIAFYRHDENKSNSSPAVITIRFREISL